MLCLYFSACSIAHAFSFSEEEEKERNEERKAAQRYQQQAYVSDACKAKLKNKKIAFIIGETHVDGQIYPVIHENYGTHFQIINQRLRQFGMKTYTEQEINNQIAQEEIASVLNNDPDAAVTAAKRLGANYILRGTIHSRSNFNYVARANEVFVNMAFTLSNSSGRTVADAMAGGDSWAGSDTLSVSLGIVRDNAAQIVGKLYRDYCSSL